MANQPNQKLKLLRLFQIFFEKTDEHNGLSTQDLIDELANYDLKAERKAIYRDIEALNQAGFTIKRHGHTWYLAERPLKLEELVMLVDAVQSAPFLTEEITDELIGRIQQLASLDQRGTLERRIDVPNRIKMQNQNVLNNLDIIQQAMRAKQKIAFKYFSYNINKERELRRGGHEYILTPIRLIYADEFYYLIAFSDHYADMEGHLPFSPYRVDRMIDVHVSDEPATRDPRIANFATEEHLSPSFGIYAAEKVSIVLEFDQEAMNPIIDKFGIDAVIFEQKRDRARAYVKAPLSPQFYGWLLQLGSLVKLIAPTEAVNEYTRLLKQTLNRYQNSYHICSEAARKVITQDQFIELIDHIKAALDHHISTERSGAKFDTQSEFNTVALRAAQDWLANQGIDDGMPHHAPKPLTSKRNGRDCTIYVATINFDKYRSYGQILGESLVAVNPSTYATEEAQSAFTSTFEHYDQEWGNGFVFTELPPINHWEKLDKTTKRYSLPDGAFYELQKTRQEEHIFFANTAQGVPQTELQPWSGTYKSAGSYKAALKHWQLHAYQFAYAITEQE